MDDVTLPPKYKPNRKESFMNLRQREYFRRKLLAWKEDILKEAQETLQHLQEDNTPEPDLADRASTESERTVELRTRDRQRKLTAKIDAALDMQDEMGASASDTLPEGDAAEMRFELAGVIIDGSSIYSARELLPVYRHFLGSEVSVNDLYSISHAITRRYAAEGYAAATAVVPTQSIQSGVATIRIEESFLGDIIVVD